MEMIVGVRPQEVVVEACHWSEAIVVTDRGWC